MILPAGRSFGECFVEHRATRNLPHPNRNTPAPLQAQRMHQVEA
jgi:hypothetical protein